MEYESRKIDSEGNASLNISASDICPSAFSELGMFLVTDFKY